MNKNDFKSGILGIDPGKNGALVYWNGETFIKEVMPLKPDGDIDYLILSMALRTFKKDDSGMHIYLERAVAFSMGTTGAFNYGRGFATIEIAILTSNISFTMVEPGKWAKAMHAGINSKYKPKDKSLIAVQRLHPSLIRHIPKGPKSGKLHDGVVDALLIATYGLRELNGVSLKKKFTDEN